MNEIIGIYVGLIMLLLGLVIIIAELRFNNKYPTSVNKRTSLGYYIIGSFFIFQGMVPIIAILGGYK